MRFIVAILCTFCVSPVFADFYSERVFTYKDVDYVTRVPRSVPEELAWEPGSPLKMAPDQAFTIARKAFEYTFSKIGKFHLDTIALSRISKPNGWLYLVVFVQDSSEVKFTNTGGDVKHANPVTLVYYVTFDGSVYGPRPRDG